MSQAPEECPIKWMCRQFFESSTIFCPSIGPPFSRAKMAASAGLITLAFFLQSNQPQNHVFESILLFIAIARSRGHGLNSNQPCTATTRLNCVSAARLGSGIFSKVIWRKILGSAATVSGLLVSDLQRYRVGAGLFLFLFCFESASFAVSGLQFVSNVRAARRERISAEIVFLLCIFWLVLS